MVRLWGLFANSIKSQLICSELKHSIAVLLISFNYSCSSRNRFFSSSMLAICSSYRDFSSWNDRLYSTSFWSSISLDLEEFLLKRAESRSTAIKDYTSSCFCNLSIFSLCSKIIAYASLPEAASLSALFSCLSTSSFFRSSRF